VISRTVAGFDFGRNFYSTIPVFLVNKSNGLSCHGLLPENDPQGKQHRFNQSRESHQAV